jgi:hypothetical protein
MGKTIQLRADESLAQTLERIRIEIAKDLKSKYNLTEVTIHGTLASQVLAAKFNGAKSLSFNIRKVGLNRGVLELL